LIAHGSNPNLPRIASGRCNKLNTQSGLPTMAITLESDAARAYAVLAPAYDLLTADYAYGPWLGALERLALRHGLSGRRLLDVGCGTGKSFMPLLERGFEVTACDISPEMVAEARHKAGGRAELLVADMRRLPVLGEFDLITCLDDAINHLLGPDELADAFDCLRANLAPSGLLVFDVNTLAAYREIPDVVVEDDERLICWRGGLAELAAPGEEADVVIDVFTHEGNGLWRRSLSRQRHRHHPLEEIREVAQEAGLEVAAVVGQRPGAVLDDELDERVHGKAVFVMRREGSSR
jgi:SAM-dependent methyltransferase